MTDYKRSDGIYLISVAWDYFWKHCPDPSAQASFDSYDDEEYLASIASAEEILSSL